AGRVLAHVAPAALLAEVVHGERFAPGIAGVGREARPPAHQHRVVGRPLVVDAQHDARVARDVARLHRPTLGEDEERAILVAVPDGRDVGRAIAAYGRQPRDAGRRDEALLALVQHACSLSGPLGPHTRPANGQSFQIEYCCARRSLKSVSGSLNPWARTLRRMFSTWRFSVAVST